MTLGLLGSRVVLLQPEPGCQSRHHLLHTDSLGEGLHCTVVRVLGGEVPSSGEWSGQPLQPLWKPHFP